MKDDNDKSLRHAQEAPLLARPRDFRKRTPRRPVMIDADPADPSAEEPCPSEPDMMALHDDDAIHLVVL